MNILSIKQLTKRYGAITAVNQLNLKVEKGNIYGLLGPNGSGKTTTLGIVLGITNKDSGEYTWFEGKYGQNARRKVGALLETPNFYPYLNADQNLDLIAHIKKVNYPNFDEILELVNLKHRRKAAFRAYSLGMRQRLAIAGALVGDPEVLIFDEPTNGLDPQGIAEVRGIIQRIAESGKTILMASHILDEVEKVCSHVAIIKNGKLLAQGTIGQIINNDKIVEVASDNLENLTHLLQSIHGINSIDKENNRLILSVDADFSSAKLNYQAFQAGIQLSHLVVKTKSLEAEFLEITKS